MWALPRSSPGHRSVTGEQAALAALISCFGCREVSLECLLSNQLQAMGKNSVLRVGGVCVAVGVRVCREIQTFSQAQLELV